MELFPVKWSQFAFELSSVHCHSRFPLKYKRGFQAQRKLGTVGSLEWKTPQQHMLTVWCTKGEYEQSLCCSGTMQVTKTTNITHQKWCTTRGFLSGSSADQTESSWKLQKQHTQQNKYATVKSTTVSQWGCIFITKRLSSTCLRTDWEPRWYYSALKSSFWHSKE